jgi:hypothetical protein
MLGPGDPLHDAERLGTGRGDRYTKAGNLGIPIAFELRLWLKGLDPSVCQPLDLAAMVDGGGRRSLLRGRLIAPVCLDKGLVATPRLCPDARRCARL